MRRIREAEIFHPAAYTGQSPIKVNKLGHFLYEITDIERTAQF